MASNSSVNCKSMLRWGVGVSEVSCRSLSTPSPWDKPQPPTKTRFCLCISSIQLPLVCRGRLQAIAKAAGRERECGRVHTIRLSLCLVSLSLCLLSPSTIGPALSLPPPTFTSLAFFYFFPSSLLPLHPSSPPAICVLDRVLPSAR